MVIKGKMKDLNYVNDDFTFPHYYSRTDHNGNVTYRSPMSHKWDTKIPNNHTIDCNSKSRCVVYNIIWHAKSLLPGHEFSMTKFRSYITETCLEIVPDLKVSSIKSILTTTIASLNRLKYIGYDGKSKAAISSNLIEARITDILANVVKDLAGGYIPTGTRSEYSSPVYKSEAKEKDDVDYNEGVCIDKSIESFSDDSFTKLIDISKGNIVFYVWSEGVIRMVDYACDITIVDGVTLISTKFDVVNFSNIEFSVEDAVKKAGMVS